ncbi:MAG: hypothetical protein SOX46_09255 [Clostridiaceae bacterium]|nr:hypothetical protein [Clostridiaceae bacterium]
MGIVTVLSAYVLNKGEMNIRGIRLSIQGEAAKGPDNDYKAAMAILTPMAFFGGMLPMLPFHLKGGDEPVWYGEQL